MRRESSEHARTQVAHADFNTLAERSRAICALVSKTRLALREQRAQLLASRAARAELASVDHPLHASPRST